MAETQDLKSPEQPVTTDVPVMPTDASVPLTPEEAEMWLTKKGSIPKAIRKQVALLRRKKRMADRHVEVTPKGIVQRPRMELFLSEFINNGGNATQAALSVFNCSSIESAAVMGHKYLKQARGLSRVYLEKKGYTYGKMLDIATQKLEASKTPEWWDRLMKMADYADFMTKKDSRPSVVNIVQTQKSLASEFGFTDGEVVEEDDGSEEL